jgi:transcriptional regulator
MAAGKGNRHGSFPGESNKNARLTEESVRAIRRLRAIGWSLRRIAELFGTSLPNASWICRGKGWKHVV